MLCTIIIHSPLGVLEKPGMGNEEIGNEKGKREMGNGDIWKGLGCTHHSLQAKLTMKFMNAKLTCNQLSAVNAMQS